jgi:hypothetical protein
MVSISLIETNSTKRPALVSAKVLPGVEAMQLLIMVTITRVSVISSVEI